MQGLYVASKRLEEKRSAAMADNERQSITALLRASDATAGDVSENLLPLVYEELRQRARAMLARERPGQTLQATALVHEAFLRVQGTDKVSWQGRRHFYAAAAESMRRILVEAARRKKSLKGGGELQRSDLVADAVAFDIPPERQDTALEVDEALLELEAVDPRARQIVNLRYFAGFSVQETAEALSLSVSTIEAEWRFVRAWLRDRLGDLAP